MVTWVKSVTSSASQKMIDCIVLPWNVDCFLHLIHELKSQLGHTSCICIGCHLKRASDRVLSRAMNESDQALNVHSRALHMSGWTYHMSGRALYPFNRALDGPERAKSDVLSTTTQSLNVSFDDLWSIFKISINSSTLLPLDFHILHNTCYGTMSSKSSALIDTHTHTHTYRLQIMFVIRCVDCGSRHFLLLGLGDYYMIVKQYNIDDTYKM